MQSRTQPAGSAAGARHARPQGLQSLHVADRHHAHVEVLHQPRSLLHRVLRRHDSWIARHHGARLRTAGRPKPSGSRTNSPPSFAGQRAFSVLQLQQADIPGRAESTASIVLQKIAADRQGQRVGKLYRWQAPILQPCLLARPVRVRFFDTS